MLTTEVGAIAASRGGKDFGAPINADWPGISRPSSISMTAAG